MRTLLQPTSAVPALTHAALLVARVGLGAILLAHGWQKLREYTLEGTAEAFGGMGVPFPTAAATFATAVELIGGAALILGVLTPVAAALSTANLLGALVLVHAPNGMFVDNGGYELVLALIAGLVVVSSLGAGRFSVDGLLIRARDTSASASEPLSPTTSHA